jgi:hypothetical protein
MDLRRFAYRSKVGLSVGLIVLLLALAPFAVAQDVHHELAAVDTDGHEHSENDLCQWVQHHTAGSFDCDAPKLAVCDLVRQYEPPAGTVVHSADRPILGPSRAPPRN